MYLILFFLALARGENTPEDVAKVGFQNKYETLYSHPTLLLTLMITSETVISIFSQRFP